MSIEIQLILEIEKHQCLYNFNLPEYNRKDITEEAWGQVAANTNLSVNDCKEKWRNIRSSFLRSLKPSGSKIKKPYYLTDYLQFIVPFMKPINSIETIEDTQTDAQVTNSAINTEILINAIKLEPEIEFDEAVQAEYNNITNMQAPDLQTSSSLSAQARSSLYRKRKRTMTTPAKSYAEYMKNKNKRLDTGHNIADLTTNEPENDAIRLFLMSLLPELETMTEDQVRLFKIKVMMLIDEIKTNYAQLRQNSTSLSNTERLQNRLINLLLKNLRRTT